MAKWTIVKRFNREFKYNGKLRTAKIEVEWAYDEEITDPAIKKLVDDDITSAVVLKVRASWQGLEGVTYLGHVLWGDGDFLVKSIEYGLVNESINELTHNISELHKQL